MSSTVNMIMAITLSNINQLWSVEALSSRRAACHRSIGVSAKKTAFNPVVITDAVTISIFQMYYLTNKARQFPQYFIGDPDSPGVGLEAVLGLDHIDELGCNISVGFFQ